MSVSVIPPKFKDLRLPARSTVNDELVNSLFSLEKEVTEKDVPPSTFEAGPSQIGLFWKIWLSRTSLPFGVPRYGLSKRSLPSSTKSEKMSQSLN